MTARSMFLITALGAFVWAVAGCGDDSGPSGPAYEPVIPATWASTVSNPYFSLVPGTRAVFISGTAAAGAAESTIVEVLSETRVVGGVTATVVRDRVFENGALAEDTEDWFAQDSDGNVWYLGEYSQEIENGQVVSTEGSWEWGVDEALPGIIMWADPSAHIGESYRQEFYEDEAEDWGKVVALDQTVEVPYGTFNNCVQIEEWDGLDEGPHETKYYAPSIGVVLEVEGGGRLELVDLVTPPAS